MKGEDTRPAQATQHQQVNDVLQDAIVSLDHIAIAVERLEEAVDLVHPGAGFRSCSRKRSTRGERTGMVSAVLACGGVVIVLVQGTEPESQVSRFISELGAGVQHVAFGVRDLDEAVTRLNEAGGAIDTPIIRDAGIRQAFVRRDPGSGVRVELIERKGGDFTDESVSGSFERSKPAICTRYPWTSIASTH